MFWTIFYEKVVISIIHLYKADDSKMKQMYLTLYDFYYFKFKFALASLYTGHSTLYS